MLPNLSIPPIEIYGSLRIEPFWILALIAVFVGCELAHRRAKRTGLNIKIMVDGLLWIMAASFVIAHWTTLLFFNPVLALKNPLSLLMVWDGLSSLGGFFGGFLGALVYFKRKKVPFLEYIEAVLFGLVPAWIIGRIGCTVAFDHPGQTTDFFLGMVDKYGVVRHNLGFYEMLLAIFLTAVLYGTRNIRIFDGFHFALMVFLYAPVRLVLDTLRVSEKTYWGLTLGQCGSIAFLGLGIYLVIRGLKKRVHYARALKTSDGPIRTH
jgi:phosphatidylglycerol:prolipoprotein diacylglycerol transferase